MLNNYFYFKTSCAFIKFILSLPGGSVETNKTAKLEKLAKNK